MRETVPLAGLGTAVATVALAALTGSCSDAGTTGGRAGELALESTRLCPLVPARDRAAASFPPAPPVEVFGTALGWTYQAPDGSVPILFGDSWQRIDVLLDLLGMASVRRRHGADPRDARARECRMRRRDVAPARRIPRQTRARSPWTNVTGALAFPGR